MRVDLRDRDGRIVNAGHPLPLRLRDGRVEEIDLRIEPPFGVVPGKAFDVQPFPLQPGDRIVFLTDGMQERNAANLDVAAGAGRQRRPAPPRGGPRARRRGPARDRRRPAGRRDDGLPRLVRRPAARPRHRAGRRSRPRLGAALTRTARTGDPGGR